jgi:hypothetical protein
LIGPRKCFLVTLLWISAWRPAAADVGLDALVELEYQREVLMYCGIGDPEAVQGFLLRQDELLRQFELNEEDHREAMSRARRLAHEEWQNRGLGGFRGWCRSEGATYTDTLKSYTNTPNTTEPDMQTGETE